MAPKRNRPEQQIQRAVVEYLRIMENLGELTFFHVPNGGRRSKAEAGIFKSLGVRAGVPDIVVMFPGGKCAFIEIKAPEGRLSAAQKAFKDTVEAMGSPYAECRGVDEVEKFVRGLIANHEYRDGAVRVFQPQKFLGPKPDLHKRPAVRPFKFASDKVFE